MTSVNIDVSSVRRRLFFSGVVIFVLGIALLGRLWYVQVVQVHTLAGTAAEQSIRRLRLTPQRGRIFDSTNRLIVDNTPSYDLVFRPAEMRRTGRRQNTIDHIMEQAYRIGEIIDRPVEISPANIERHLYVRPPVPLTAFRNLNEVELARAMEHLPTMRGIEIEDNYIRQYHYQGIGAHVLGFTGQRRPPDEIDNRQYSYVMPEPRGRSGLERYYDEQMAGRPGMKMVSVDPVGYVFEQIGREQHPQDGADLVLNLDVRAQKTAEDLLQGKKGAIVVVDVNNGAILTMASAPTYDLSNVSAESYARLAADEEDRPLVNRAIAAGYIPGSILKPLIGLAALKHGIIDADDEIYCTGRYPIGNTRIRCWLRSGHGDLEMIGALGESCNSYFIDIGMKTGLDQLRPLFLDAGLGRVPELDIAGVGAGLVPSRPWARERLGRNWIAIDTAFLSIGQGIIGISPLQAALFTAAIGNGGTVYNPSLVQRIIAPDGQVTRRTAPRPVSKLNVNEKHLRLIQKGMEQAVNGERGTARSARTNVVSLAGKTGTAQVQTPGDEHNDTWFIGYGPVDNPRYAICILVEYGDSGGRTAAPLAREFFENWLGPQ